VHKIRTGFVVRYTTETGTTRGSWVEYHPMTTVVDGSPIDFDISGTGEDYIDFGNTMQPYCT